MAKVYEVGRKNHIEKSEWTGKIDFITAQLAGFEIIGKYDDRIFIRRKRY